MNQENQGILSPILSKIRLKEVAKKIIPNSVIFDIGCGNGNLSNYIPKNCNYYGIDIISPKHRNFTNFFKIDINSPNFFDEVKNKFKISPDYITCIAFIEHISNIDLFLNNCKKILSEKNGYIIGTTPHPHGKKIHELMSKLYLTSKDAAKEHNDFISKEDLETISKKCNLNLVYYKKFLFGLNQLFIFK